MKSETVGNSISPVEVTNISTSGMWLLIADREYFLPYETFPWFKEAKIADIQNVQMQHGRYLFWPSLDIDLELDSIDHPEKYPLRYS